MAQRRQQTRQRQRTEEQAPKRFCRDCAESYDWHSKALDGHLILCRCPYKQQGGKFSIFLSDPACEEHFKPRTENNGKETAATKQVGK